MIRKQARIRREYLHRKSLTDKQRERLDRKVRIREALETGAPIKDSDLRAETMEKEYGVYFDFEKEKEEKETKIKSICELDNEYAFAGKTPPKILITNGREVSEKLKKFVKEMKLIFPYCSRINRVQNSIETVVSSAKKNGFTDIVVFHETKGEPSSMIVSHLPYGFF
jgi:U3 small nucleolar ribonucleoprotein protein IMP4